MKRLVIGLLGLACVGLLTGGCSSGASHAKIAAAPTSPVGAAADAGTSSTVAAAATSSTADDSSAADSAPPASANCSGSDGMKVCVTASLSGDVSVSGAAEADPPTQLSGPQGATCAQLAVGNGSHELQVGDDVDGVGGHSISWDGTLKQYNGPGTYDLSHNGAFFVKVDDAYYGATNGTVSVTVKPDFAVTFAVAGLSRNGGGSISGTISWTCVGQA